MYDLKELFKEDEMTYTEISNAVIPRIIHRIWVGGAITKDSFGNLIKFQDKFSKISGNIYGHILWTTESTLEKMRKAQYKDSDKVIDQEKELKNRGMTIRKFEEVLQLNGCKEYDEKIVHEIKARIGTGRTTDLKYLSDLLRLYILFRWGGIYMDVDIGIGREKFKDCFYHRYQFCGEENAYMPLLGSEAPFKPCPNQEFYEYEKKQYIEAGGEYPWNYFFATVEKNEIIKSALDLAIGNNDSQTIAANMVARFREDLDKAEKFDPGKKLFECAFAPLELQYATEASEEG